MPINISASAATPGMKVVVTQPITCRAITDGTSNTLRLGDIPPGTIGRVIDTKAGRISIGVGELTPEADVIELRDFDFEKHFAERL